MSKDQGWGTPGGPPGEGGQGPYQGGAPYPGGMPYGGAPGGWGWAPPPPPKPGVIPLAPLSAGDIVGGAFATLTRYWKPLFGMAGAVYGALTALMALCMGVGWALAGDELRLMFSRYDSPDPADVLPAVIGLGAVALIGLVGLLLGSCAVYAGTASVVREAVMGRPATFSAVWRQAWARVPSVLGAVLLPGLAIMGVMAVVIVLVTVLMAVIVGGDGERGVVIALPLAFLALIPLMTWIHIRFVLAPPAAVFEPQRTVAALRRSSRLVRGSWWRVFGLILLGALIAMALTYAVQLPFSLVGMVVGMPGMALAGDQPDPSDLLTFLVPYMVITMVGAVIGQGVSQIYTGLVSSLVYVDRRIRQENLAATLLEATAVPAHHQQAPPAGQAPSGENAPGDPSSGDDRGPTDHGPSRDDGPGTPPADG